MEQMPLVSVLMTAFNREALIGLAIQSVLNSTYKNFELIIVDDRSTDNTLQIAKEYEQKDSRIKVYENETNLGDYPNRNKVASYAKGKYLKYCDSDEQLYPHCIEIFVESMERYPDAALGLSHMPNNRMHPYMVTAAEAYRLHYFDHVFFRNAPTSTIIRREEFEREGGFNPIRHRGDYDLWLRMGAKYPVVRLPAILTFDVEHPDQEKKKNMLYKKVLVHNISMGALKSEDCPLEPQEIEKASKKWRYGFIRQNILMGLMKLKLKEVRYLLKEGRVSFGEIIQSILA